MRSLILFTAFALATAASARTPHLSPVGETEVKRYYAELMTDPVNRRLVAEMAAPSREIDRQLAAPNPDVDVITGLMKRQVEAKSRFLRATTDRLVKLIKRLPPDDQVIFLHDMYPVTTAPTFVPLPGPSKTKPTKE